VALLGFYVPSDSGEKVSMGITTLLSMTVFLMLVAENMPPTSDVLPLVGTRKQCRYITQRIDGHSVLLGEVKIQPEDKHSTLVGGAD